MSAGSRRILIVVGWIFLFLSVGSCGGGGGCGCDLPRRANDWLIDVDLGYIPEEITHYPFAVEITVWVSHLENGGPAPDGLMVALTIEPGSFDTGLTELRQPIVGGRVSARVQIDNPGSYTLTVGIPGETLTATFTFIVGL